MGEWFVHDTAIVDEGAKIGKGTKIWHFSHLMGGCSIGEHCILGQNTFVASKVILGDRVKVQNNVSIYEGVECEDEVFIGPSVVFTNVINPRSGVERKDEYKMTLVKKGVSIGANATIVCGVTLGQYAFIGAGAVVTRDVKDFELVHGNPAKHAGWMSAYGKRLKFDQDNTAVCSGSGQEYKLENKEVKVLS